MRIFKSLFILFSPVLLALASVGCLAKNAKGERGKIIYSSLSSKYGVENVMAAVFFTTDCMEAFKQAASVDNIDYCTIEKDLVVYYKNENAMDSLYDCLGASDSALIATWCQLDNQLNQVDISGDGQSSFESVLYSMVKGKVFFNPYLEDEDQYYGSLDFNQSCQLYFDVLVYLVTKADLKEREVFLSEYYKQYNVLKQ